MKVYIVTEPASIRGIYDTWAECKAKATVGVVRYTRVSACREQIVSRHEACRCGVPTGHRLPMRST